MDREGGTATLHSLVEENLSQYEDRVAILYDTGGSNEIITYREMWSTATLVIYLYYQIHGQMSNHFLKFQKNCLSKIEPGHEKNVFAQSASAQSDQHLCCSLLKSIIPVIAMY